MSGSYPWFRWYKPRSSGYGVNMQVASGADLWTWGTIGGNVVGTAALAFSLGLLAGLGLYLWIYRRR